MTTRFFGRRSLIVGAGGLLAAPSIVVRAQGQNGVALVIGNSKYLWEAALPNVKRDAPDVARRFQALGLRTELVLDADWKAMLAAIDRLKAGAAGVSLAAVYFAGHGVSWEKADYLVPVDSDLSNPASLKNLVRARDLYEAVNPAAHRMVVLDNCRNNPSDGWRQTEAERRAGFSAAIAGGRDSEYLMLASTAPGHIALDGPAGQNSPFAASFLRLLDQPTVDLESMGGRLRRELLIATEGRQLLFSRTSYAQSFTLNRVGPPATPAVPAPAVNPGRIVELSKAYAFAQENKYPLPVGLVAVRPANGQDSFKVGSFKSMTRNKYGRYPCVVIVMSIEKGDKADVIWSGTGYDGKPAWRYYAGSHEGNRIRLFSATGGTDSDEIMLEWKSPTSASFNMHNPLVTTGMFSADMVKLDG